MVRLMLVVIIALGLSGLALGFIFAANSMKIKPQTLEEARRLQAARCDLSWYDAARKRDYTVTCEDGYVLHAQLVECPSPTDRYVILSHGYTDNRFGTLKYARFYLELGFNAVIYDLRGHGLNAATFCTYSVRESRDLNCVIGDCIDRFSPGVLGIHGESLGAATSVAVLKYRPKINFAVADCGFSEIRSIMIGAMKRSHIPACLIPVSALFAKILYGYTYSQMRPIDSLAENDIPILFIHGAEDNFIFPFHSQRMAEATRGYSELHMIPGAHHAASALTAPEKYLEILRAFWEGQTGI